MSRPTMATMKALREEKEALESALATARAEIDARDEKIEALEDERDAAKHEVARLRAAVDELAAGEYKANMRFDAAIYAMVLMQREVRTLRDAPRPRARTGNEGEWKWDGKDWVALAS